MIVSLKPAYCITLAVYCITLGGCSLSSPKPETRVISVPSSAPYRYIKPNPKEDKLSKETLDQISRHNTTHALVKKKEAEASKQ